MHASIVAAVPLAMLTLAGCMSMAGEKPGGMAGTPAALPSATAALADPAGAPRGTAAITQVAGGIRVVFDATGLPPGEHGVHLHMTGKCEAPAFASAGGHWNPTMKKHGMKSPEGPHEGDLPNIVIGADGTGHLDATVPGATLTGGAMPLMDADGAALVVHAGPDDYMTDPAGNSGGRVACGVLTAA